MFGALKGGHFRSLASLILVVNVVGELQRKRTLAASRGFLAAARLSCWIYWRIKLAHSTLVWRPLTENPLECLVDLIRGSKYYLTPAQVMVILFLVVRVVLHGVFHAQEVSFSFLGWFVTSCGQFDRFGEWPRLVSLFVRCQNYKLFHIWAEISSLDMVLADTSFCAPPNFMFTITIKPIISHEVTWSN